jgi:hypothetical protein
MIKPIDHRKLSEITKTEWIRLIRTYKNMTKIAKALNCTREGVKYNLAKYNLKAKVVMPKKVAPARLKNKPKFPSLRSIGPLPYLEPELLSLDALKQFEREQEFKDEEYQGGGR